MFIRKQRPIQINVWRRMKIYWIKVSIEIILGVNVLLTVFHLGLDKKEICF